MWNTKITHRQHVGRQQRLSTADADESWTGSKDKVFLPVLTAETATLWIHGQLTCVADKLNEGEKLLEYH